MEKFSPVELLGKVYVPHFSKAPLSAVAPTIRPNHWMEGEKEREKGIPKSTYPTQNRDVCTASKGYCLLALLPMTKYGRKNAAFSRNQTRKKIEKEEGEGRDREEGRRRGVSLSCTLCAQRDRALTLTNTVAGASVPTEKTARPRWQKPPRWPWRLDSASHQLGGASGKKKSSSSRRWQFTFFSSKITQKLPLVSHMNRVPANQSPPRCPIPPRLPWSPPGWEHSSLWKKKKLEAVYFFGPAAICVVTFCTALPRRLFPFSFFFFFFYRNLSN